MYVDFEAEDPDGVPAVTLSKLLPLFVLLSEGTSHMVCSIGLVVLEGHDLGVVENLDPFPRSQMH